jgi:hypothetical protein
MGQTENSLDRNGDSREAGVGRAHTIEGRPLPGSEGLDCEYEQEVLGKQK